MKEELRKEIIDGGGLVDLCHIFSAPMYAIKNTKKLIPNPSEIVFTEFKVVGFVDFGQRINFGNGRDCAFYGRIFMPC